MAKQQSRSSNRQSGGAIEKHAQRVIPTRKSLILLETALVVGLMEGVMWNLITRLNLNMYFKALFLMAGVVGVFALAVRVFEPMIQSSLKVIARLDGGNSITRLTLHLLILFVIFVGYVRIFFKGA